MPLLVPPAIASGSSSASAQPSIAVDVEAMLRPWRLSDTTAVMDAFQDPAIQRWHVRRADSVDEAEQWVEQWRSGWATESNLHWAIADRDTDALVGRIALKDVDMRDGSADIAYWIVAGARGRGLCTASVIALCEWAFRHAGFHRVQLEHSAGNLASCRVAGKAGFHEEGIRRNSALHADGWHDMHMHALLTPLGVEPAR